MNNEYYGVTTTASDDFLAHYGIKGMKWGVRKAIEKGNAKALSRHYARAKKKLDKLDRNANIVTQKRLADRNKKAAAGSLAVGLTGLGTAIPTARLANKIKRNYWDSQRAYTAIKEKTREAASKLDKNAPMSEVAKVYEPEVEAWGYKYQSEEAAKHLPKINIIKTTSMGAGIGGLGSAAVYKTKQLNNKYRITEKGHKASVEKRDVFKKEMNKAFNSPEAQKLASQAKASIQKANNKSAQRKAKEAKLNSEYVKKQAQKQEKARQKLTNKIGKVNQKIDRIEQIDQINQPVKTTKKPAKKPAGTAKKKSSGRKYFTKQDFKDAAKAAALSTVMGPAAASYVNMKRIANEIPANNNRHGKRRKRS